MRTDLEQALLRDRDNVRLWAVYADWLESQGDVRGALSSLMLRREAAPSRAMDEALLAQAPLVLSLTPESLKTLETRGEPRLAPVFRRGFLFSAGATQASDFEALLHHPSAAFLDTVILESEELADWFAKIDRPLPWRRLEVNGLEATSLDLTSLAPHLPFLETLTLDSPCEDVTFPALPSLRQIRLRRPHVANVEALVKTPLPALESVELLCPRERIWEAPELDPLVLALRPRLSKLARVVLEGDPGETTRELARSNVLVRTSQPPDHVFPDSLRDGLEQSFAVLRGELSSDQRETIVTFATLAGVRRLTITQASFPLGSAPLQVLRFNGNGELPITARSAIQQLAKKDRKLDAFAFTLSGSNNVANAWSIGPHVALKDEDPRKRKMVPALRWDESASSRHALARSVVGALAGLDPGLDVLEDLLAALERGTTHVLVGDALARGERLPLFTDHAAVPEEEEQDEYDRDPDEEEEEEEISDEGWDVTPVDPWGAAPVNVPDFGPIEATVPEGEDEPDEDLDPPLHDASTADEEEIWVEGPVDLPEHHDSLPGDPIVEHELESLERPSTDPCPRCHQHGETQRCVQCLEEVCRSCAGSAAEAVWDEERAFSCVQCEPIAPGRFVAPRVVAPTVVAPRG